MALGSYKETEYHSIAGLSLGSASAGIKTPNRQDLVVIKAVHFTKYPAHISSSRGFSGDSFDPQVCRRRSSLSGRSEMRSQKLEGKSKRNKDLSYL